MVIEKSGLQAFIAAFKDLAPHLWQAVSKKEALAASGEEAMDTGMSHH